MKTLTGYSSESGTRCYIGNLFGHPRHDRHHANRSYVTLAETGTVNQHASLLEFYPIISEEFTGEWNEKMFIVNLGVST